MLNNYNTINTELALNFLIPNYFEIILRNSCNNKLIKEFGEEWYKNNVLLNGDNKDKGKWAIKEINKAKEKILKNKNCTNINNGAIVSNSELSFWTNLFCTNYSNNIWRPYLKYLFKNNNRKFIFQNLNNIRELRNRIFHYEPIIFKFDLIRYYNSIINIISLLTNKEIVNEIKNLNNFEKTYQEYKNII